MKQFSKIHESNIYFILLRALIEKFLVHLHEQLEGVVDEAVDGLVPVVLAVPVQGGEHDRENGRSVVTYQTHNIPANNNKNDQTHNIPENNNKYGHGNNKIHKIRPTQKHKSTNIHLTHSRHKEVIRILRNQEKGQSNYHAG